MKRLRKITLLGLLIPFLFGCGEMTTAEEDYSGNEKDFAMNILTETRTTQYFNDERVPLDDINAILDAGRNALSGMNMQPWHFSAIINPTVIKKIAGSMSMAPPPGVPAPVASGTAASGGSVTPRPVTSTAYPKAGFADAPAAIAV